MKKKIFIFIISLISCITYSQSTEDVILKDPEFEILKEKSTELYTSETYLNYKNINSKFMEKVGTDFFMDAEKGSFEPENYKKWIEKNLDKTNFTSLEEAILVHKEYYNASLKMRNAEKEQLISLSKLINKYGKEKFGPVYIKYILNKLSKFID